MKKFRIVIGLVVLLLFLLSCGKNNFETIGNGSISPLKTFPVTFEFSVPEMNLVSDPNPMPMSGQNKSIIDVDINSITEKVMTRAELDPIANESLLEGLWVLQFNSSNLLVMSSYYPGAEINNGQLSVSISEEPLSVIYFIANVPPTQFDNLKVGGSTVSEFEKLTLKYANEAAVSNSGKSLPMVGRFNGSPATSPISIALTRMVAKITFTCKVDLKFSDENFLLQSIRLRNVSTLSSYREVSVPTVLSGIKDRYPPSGSGNFMNYDFIEVDPAQAENSNFMKNTGITIVSYVPENLQGIVAGLSERLKGYGMAPLSSTFIEMQGIYTKNGVRSEISYEIYPGENSSTDFNLVRNHHYAIVATIRGNSDASSSIPMGERDRRVIIPADLSSSGGTANCYMVHTAGVRYRFPAVSGNGAGFIGSSNIGNETYTYQFGKLETSGYSPVLLWETDKYGSVIEPGSVSTLDGYVYFTTAGVRGEAVKEGNALIGWNKNNVPAWSWHIWSTSYKPYTDTGIVVDETDVYKIYNGDQKIMWYYVMKYDLGANGSAPEGSVERYGLLYQWGRKDPFMRAEAVYSLNPAATYNAPGFEWKEEKVSRVGFKEGIEYVVEHPTVRFVEWSSPIVATPTAFWGEAANNSSKTGFDPCPPGWRVPPADFWDAISNDDRNNAQLSNFNKGANLYFDKKSSATTFYPAGGCYFYDFSSKDKSDILLLNNSGKIGSYWTRSYLNASDCIGIACYFDSTHFIPKSQQYVTFTYPVRCVKE